MSGRDASAAPWEGLSPEALATLAGRRTELVEEIIDAIRVEVPAYRRPLTGRFGEGVRLGVQEALRQFEAMSREPGLGRAAGRELYIALGRGEFRHGRSLEALLAAYRTGARVTWRRLAAAGLEAGLPPETLVQLAESIFAYIDELSSESAEGYAAEQAARAGEAERRRGALVEALLREPAPPPDALAAAADAARWAPPRRIAVLVWPDEHGRRPAGRLPMGTLVATIGGVACAVVPDPLAPGRRAEIERALDGIPAGLGSPVPIDGGARSYHRALSALAVAQPADGGLVVADERRAALLCRADPALVADIAADRLAPLDEETPASRLRLEATLLAWLRHQGNVPAAAEELVVHPQTVRYRLTRLRELLGGTLEDPDARFELEAALRARAGD
jgi:hypothetical protein